MHAANAAGLGANVYAAGAMITDEDYPSKASLLRNSRKTDRAGGRRRCVFLACVAPPNAAFALLRSYAREHKMTVLLSNYSGMTGGCESAGRSAIWSETGKLVAASAGTGEELVIGRSSNGTRE